MAALDQRLEERLSLLQGSEQVDGDVAAFMRKSLAELGARLGLEVTDEHFGTLCTHTALALQRARDGASISSWETDHSDELGAHPCEVAAAEEFADGAESILSVEVPAQEREFIALHLASLSMRRG
jgi:transcriptional regulatory protein LevR